MPVVQLYVQPLPGEEYVALVGGPHDGRAVLRKDVRAERGLEPRIQMEDAAYELSGASYYFVEPDGTDPVPEVES